MTPGVRPKISVFGVQEGDRACSYVQDNGVGIDLQDQAGIFEPFVRLPVATGSREG